MTQIDSTAQTDLGISDHEELLLPYKAIYSQLLDTIREVVTQTLDSTYGAGAPRITTEVLEIALKDNLNTLIPSPDKKSHHKVVKKTERLVNEANVDPKLLKMLQNTGGLPQQPDIFNQTTNQLLKLIELNNLNSELNKSHSKLHQLSPYLSYSNLHKVNSNPYSTLLSQQQSNIFNSSRTTTPATYSHVPKPFSPPVVPTLQKVFHSTPPTPVSESVATATSNSNHVAPKVFTPGVIKSEAGVSPARSPQQAFSTETAMFPPFTATHDSVTATSPVQSSEAVLNKAISTPSPQPTTPRSFNLTPSSHPLLPTSSLASSQGILGSQLSPSHGLLTQQSLLTSTPQGLFSTQSLLTPHSSPSPATLLAPSPLATSHHDTAVSTGLQNSVLFNNAALLNNAATSPSALLGNAATSPSALLGNAATSPSALLGNVATSQARLLSSAASQGTGTLRNNMEVHQNFIKQINLLNQTAPSMLGQKLGNMAGHAEAPASDHIEKVLMDIKVNLTNIKPDPWGAAKDKLYKCPHCDTAFARRQYLSNHIINVHNLKTCPECKTTFSNEEAFNAHLALHPKKEYECGSCNKSFNSVYLLKNHRKTHVKDKPFACNICGKTFADKYYLRNHFSIHSPVKPYSCPVCGRGFASSSALRYHSFQHTGEKPAKCQYCPSEFVQKNQLKLHIARKHKELISSLNPLHEGDIIPGNMSLGSSPSASPAHSSPKHNIQSPPEKQITSIPHTPVVPAAAAQNKEGEPMQVDNQEPSLAAESKENIIKSEAPTVAMATEQLQELIASLQRSSKSTNKTEGSANNFTISSPFSKITDGINQLLEGGAAGESHRLETS